MKIKSLSIYKIKNVIKIHLPHFQNEILILYGISFHKRIKIQFKFLSYNLQNKNGRQQKEIACVLSLIGINRAKQNTIKNRNKKRQISEDEEKTI